MKIKELISWSKKEFSKLPWRENRSLYNTLVSEIMLQQTTVSTVKNHFDKFIKKYPDLNKLSQTTEEEMLVAWKGLGYYRRAKNLRNIAKIIVNKFGGVIPNDKNELLKISGIGPYTASALLAMGMDRPALAVDANIERVVSRLYGLKTEKGLKLQNEIFKLFEAREILFFKTVSYRELNEALMDLGRNFCQARKTSCELCPMQSECVAFKTSKPLEFPKIDSKKKKEEHDLALIRCYVLKKDKLLVYKKNEKEWLSGQYEVPTFILKSSDKDIKQYPYLKKQMNLKGLPKIKTGITKYKIENYIVSLNENEFESYDFNKSVEWRNLNELDSNFSTATLKGLKKI